ncbi:hypothetical protein K450DRAFT_198057 [Umbelopsis ramanniana AG]|uniref:PIN domain-containing protein n=1 Tax=Umbelopsis ramanniana AG TaxID=1314678 RepID=A0AAD5EDH7_UMBRA|nr:uncharacterized protein K450DRAFT_198057 [Umbelopsis ramanniana AG]KAI8581000.1 hypothetical protein K450DRAFT_198057 [Umbelopsis ramanniana AG]
MFSTDKTNFLIIDTCTLLHSPDLITKLVSTVYRKSLNFTVVIPTIVIRELLAQEYNNTGRKMLSTYTSWATHPMYKSRKVLLAKEATQMYGFLKRYIAMDVPNLVKQGNLETKNYPIVVSHLSYPLFDVVADDLILDCLLYYHEKYDGNATLISHDWELCCKAKVFKMNTISQYDHQKWRELLRACQVDVHFNLLPAKSKKRKTGLSEAAKQELMYRPMIDCDLDTEDLYRM